MKKTAVAIAAFVLVYAPAFAQAPAGPARKAPTGTQLPKTGTFLFSNACQLMPVDDAQGHTVFVTRTAAGDTLVFSEPQDGPRVSTNATDVKIDSPPGRPSSDISFSILSRAEETYRMPPRLFSGTISSTQVQLTQAGVENPEPIILPRQENTYRPRDCQ